MAGVDILAHPGKISAEDAELAAQRGVFLEITARQGHNFTNQHVAKAAKKAGAKLVFNTDTHVPNNLVDDRERERILRAAGLRTEDVRTAVSNSEILVANAKKSG